MSFWIRVFKDGVKRVGGSEVQKALKEGILGNSDLFFPKDWDYAKIVRYLKQRGVGR